ncbi:MAG: sel1 repeat family protein [Candidatus Caenarcaniphilales bacterium]|nr:sel1 repeat family protein [Candidatus Caenarcaniphilales bacterium]
MNKFKKLISILIISSYTCIAPNQAHSGFERSHCYKIYKKKLYENLLRCTEKYADNGDAMAQFFMGKIYYEGLKTPRNYKKAFEWYSKSAKQSYRESENQLGTMFDQGKGTVQNYQSAYYWYTRAALKDLADAQYNLADMLFSGRGIQQNFRQAYIWSLVAASNNHSEAVRLRDNLEISLKQPELVKTQNEASKLDQDIKSGEAIKRFMAEEKAKELARLAAKAAKKKREAEALAKKMKKKATKK